MWEHNDQQLEHTRPLIQGTDQTITDRGLHVGRTIVKTLLCLVQVAQAPRLILACTPAATSLWLRTTLLLLSQTVLACGVLVVIR